MTIQGWFILGVISSVILGGLLLWARWGSQR